MLKKGRSPTLLILDDIWHREQLDYLLPSQLQAPNLTVLITTRNEAVLKGISAAVIMCMQLLDPKQASRLFNLHAFGTARAPIEPWPTAEKAMSMCDGLPSALQHLGGTFLWPGGGVTAHHVRAFKASRPCCA